MVQPTWAISLNVNSAETDASASPPTWTLSSSVPMKQMAKTLNLSYIRKDNPIPHTPPNRFFVEAVFLLVAGFSSLQDD